MKDLIFIEGLSVFAQIGVYDWEQQIKQKLIFDVEMAWDTRQAAITDDVQYTLNYAEISQFIIDYVQSKPFLLIERVANFDSNCANLKPLHRPITLVSLLSGIANIF